MSIEVTATSDDGSSSSASFDIAITDINEAPTANDINGAMQEDQTIVVTEAQLIVAFGASDPEGDTLSVTSFTSDDPSAITITDNGNGTWTIATAPDYNGDDVGLTAVISDGNSSTTAHASIDVLPVNDAPTAINLSGTSIDENGAGAIVGTLSTTDVDTGDTHTYTVDDARFEVVGDQLKLKDGISLDHETESTVDVTVTTTDSGGLSYAQTYTINVNDINEAPTANDINGAMQEDQTIVVTEAQLIVAFGASDPEGDTLSVTSFTSDDPSAITITDNGNGTWTIATAPDYNGDDVGLTAVISDGNSSTTAHASIDVLPVNDAPTAINLSGTSIDENGAGAIVGTLSTTDVDTGDTHTYTVDDARFEVVGDQLKLKDGISLDHETESTVDVTVTTTDSGGLSYAQTYTINVNDINEAPTDLTISGNGDTFEYVVEHSNPIAFWRLGESSGDTTVVDEMGNHDGTYSQGANSTNGSSPFSGLNNTAANFDGQNDYVEIPNSPDFDMSEGTFHAWFKVDSFDGTDHTILSMDSSGTDGGSMYLAVDSNREDLEFYIEDPSGPSTGYGNNSHVITSADGSISEGVWHQVSVSFGPDGMSMYLDGNLVASDSYTGGIGNADDEPITIGASQRNASTEGQAVAGELDRFFDGQIAEVAIFNNALSQSEINTLIDVGLNAVELNGTNVVEHALPGTVVGTLTTTDPDAGDTFTYNLTDDASGRFEIDASTGELKVADDAQLDFETQASHSVTVEVTDSAGASYSESFSIDLIDVNEVLGTNGADNVSGTQLADVINGLSGDDRISGGQGDDSIHGGAGNDSLSGDAGDDQIFGGDGNDRLSGGDGEDLLIGGAGNDVAIGGAGDDVYIFEALGDSDTFSGGDGGGWTDVIELDVDITSQPDPENPWTITVDGNEVSYDVDQGFLDLGPDASGVISFDDGSEINFDGVEQIQW